MTINKIIFKKYFLEHKSFETFLLAQDLLTYSLYNHQILWFISLWVKITPRPHVTLWNTNGIVFSVPLTLVIKLSSLFINKRTLLFFSCLTLKIKEIVLQLFYTVSLPYFLVCNVKLGLF